MEEWRDINGYEGLYRISNCGRILRWIGNKWKPICLNKNVKYLRVTLSQKCKRKSFRVNRLVYETFIGKIPAGYEVHHMDGDRLNNCIGNLNAISEKVHNRIHREANPNIVKGIVDYQKNIRAKRVIQLTLDGRFVAEYPSYKEAERRTGISCTSIRKYINKIEYAQGKLRNHAGGYLWRLKDEINSSKFKQ